MAQSLRGDSGRSDYQRLRPYLVMQFFLKNADEHHPVSMQDILLYLNEDCGISAERRAIYKDIEDINKVLYMLDNAEEDGCTIKEAVETLEEYPEEAFITSGGKNGKYYMSRRPRKIEVDDIRLLAECVYNARFITSKDAERLISIVCGLVSQWDASEVKHDAFVVDRIKTNNKSVLNNVMTINYAMRRGTHDDPHEPEKVTFKYQKYSIEDVSKTVDRRKGERYKVSPYRLLINEGNYYLLAFSDKDQEMRTYRVDRMKDIRTTGEARDGEEEYTEFGRTIKTYPQRVFGMFGGKRVRPTLRFTNDLLDTVIDRFGTKEVQYSKYDEGHFTLAPEVELSKKFFSWLCSFGNKVKIIGPDFVIEEFTEYLDEIRGMY